MSLKPRKFSDLKRSQEEINAKMLKKRKKTQLELPPCMYVVSEGIKTEPYYIKGMADAINQKFFDFSSGPRIYVRGTGRNTRGLLSYARKQVEADFPQAEIVWLMYDRDDFPLDDFDNTQYSALTRKDTRKYKVAWSNECIELWFVLHFQPLVVNVGREQYRRILREKSDYEKNRKDIYEVLKDKTETAIKRARRQFQEYGDKPPSQMCPATRVYELVEELQKYLM